MENNKALEPINPDAKGVTFVRELFNLHRCKESEIVSFVSMCNEYNLDPRLRQVSAWEQGDKLVVNVNADGWFALANRQKALDGIESGVVYEGDIFQRLPNGGYKHEHGRMHGNKGKIKGAYAVVHRSDRRIPTFRWVSFSTYYQEKSKSWQTYGEAMIEKVALGRAIKLSFSLSGLYTEEEVESMKYSDAKPIEPNVEAKPIEPTPFDCNVEKEVNDFVGSQYYIDFRYAILLKRPNYTDNNIYSLLHTIVPKVCHKNAVSFLDWYGTKIGTMDAGKIIDSAIKAYEKTDEGARITSYKDYPTPFPFDSDSEKWLWCYVLTRTDGNVKNAEYIYKEIDKDRTSSDETLYLPDYLETVLVINQDGMWLLDDMIGTLKGEILVMEEKSIENLEKQPAPMEGVVVEAT